jgi:diacylglycerol kinase family enzyme
LANPRGGNNRPIGAVAAWPRGRVYREAEPKAIRSALQELAAGTPDVLVISGGDGTISAVATALRREQLFKSEPILALLRGGSTNLIQSNIGLSGRPIETLKRLLQVCDHGLPRSCCVGINQCVCS